MAMTNSCSSPRPNYKPHIFVGDFNKQQLTRGQTGEKVSCTDPKFDGYRCMSSYDLRRMYEIYVLNCNSWSEESGLTGVFDGLGIEPKNE